MNTRPAIQPTPPALVAKIAGLSDLPMEEIKALWLRLFGTPHPTHNRQFLERRIAYKLQENEFRKIDPALLERNKRRIEQLIDKGKLRKRDRDYRPVPGTVLIREYREVEYRVTVMADGQYDFQGRPYPTLSMIAREITGTSWSGPVFFGLKEPAARRKGAKR